MRWEQAIVYAVGALMVIGAAASVFQLHGAALVVGCILMVMSLADGPRGLKSSAARREAARGGAVGNRVLPFCCGAVSPSRLIAPA